MITRDALGFRALAMLCAGEGADVRYVADTRGALRFVQLHDGASIMTHWGDTLLDAVRSAAVHIGRTDVILWCDSQG